MPSNFHDLDTLIPLTLGSCFPLQLQTSRTLPRIFVCICKTSKFLIPPHPLGLEDILKSDFVMLKLRTEKEERVCK